MVITFGGTMHKVLNRYYFPSLLLQILARTQQWSPQGWILDGGRIQGRIQGFGRGGGQSWRALCAAGKILLINIHFSLKPIYFIAQTSAELSTTRYASPFAYAICMQAKVSAVRDHYCREFTGVATNNYSMNFNYLAARGGNWPPIPPLDPPLVFRRILYFNWDCVSVAVRTRYTLLGGGRL